ncbi:hypothetical protein CK203_022996 [Vitis vinifera]|uniref:Uncharacterized protein n=1 Tax=Vitis vinifera TaxID=29760 RepID=A0A438J499_VITVI|nr:hypothetical protein CK203_022996 [Vitis vinifera]
MSHCKVINFVDYSLNQGAPVGNESADTPSRHESPSLWQNMPSPCGIGIQGLVGNQEAQHGFEQSWDEERDFKADGHVLKDSWQRKNPEEKNSPRHFTHPCKNSQGMKNPSQSKIPPSEGGAPTSPSSSASQRRYETRRPPTTQRATALRPQSLVRRPLAKRARTSDPGESSRAPHPKPLVATHARAPADFELPSNMSPGSIIRHPMLTAPPIEGNSDYKLRHFHSEFYFDQEAFRQKLELRDSYGLLQRYYLEQLMTPREFFYPRVALNFYQSMTTCGVPSPTSIHFTIDGHHWYPQGKKYCKGSTDSFRAS